MKTSSEPSKTQLVAYWRARASRIDRLADRAEKRVRIKHALAQRVTAAIYRQTADLLEQA